MNAIKPKLEQKDVGYGGMRAIGDAIGKQILELQVTIDSLKAELTQLRQQQAEIEALKSDKLKYAEAVIEAMEEWGSYASDYFKEKWHFLDDYNKWFEIVRELRKAQEK